MTLEIARLVVQVIVAVSGAAAAYWAGHNHGRRSSEAEYEQDDRTPSSLPQPASVTVKHDPGK